MENTDKHAAYEQIAKDLNVKILETTMMIKNHYPELSYYLDEMPETVPSKTSPEISINHLQSYYESLSLLLTKNKTMIRK
ncbi:MAG: hypothetical protein R6U95_05465 [Bacteroidales bacterium]